MSDFELNQKLKTLAADERRLLRSVLEHIAEVDRRQLYLRMAYPSLFEYLVSEIGYSAGAAQRRIDAARTIARVPEVALKVERGELNLGQITRLRKVCRMARKRGDKVSAAKEREVLEKMEGKDNRQTDLILGQEFKLEVQTDESLKIQRDESVRVEFTFTKEEMELLEKAQAALSNQAGGNLKDTVLLMAQKIVEKSQRATATVAVKTVTPKLRREILARDKARCQFKDSQTGRICGSTHFLEIDHIQPKFAGGSNARDNLRVLCRAHNQFRYKAGL